MALGFANGEMSTINFVNLTSRNALQAFNLKWPIKLPASFKFPRLGTPRESSRSDLPLGGCLTLWKLQTEYMYIKVD